MRHRTTVAGAACALALIASFSPAHAGDTHLSPYGFVRFDAIFNDSRMVSAQSGYWVVGETPATEDDAELSIHPRLTRIGLTLDPADVGDGAMLSGKIEMDFQNGGSESRETPRMRHGYMTVRNGSHELLAGQTWDLISPLMPAANADALMWNAGNTGDRRPQLRLSLFPKMGEGKMRLAVAAGTPNAINGQDLDGNGQTDGFDAGIPVVQGLAEYSQGKSQFGVWAHWAQDEITLTAEETYTSHLFGGHVRVPIGEKLRFQGEAFLGQSASDVRAGIGQSVNTTTETEIATMGGWAEVTSQLTPKYAVSVGASMDDPDEADLNAGDRDKNSAVWLVQHIGLYERVRLGIDYIYWATDYKGGAEGRANRVDFHLTANF